MHKDTHNDYNIICKDFLIVLFSVKLKGLECISVGTLVHYYDIVQLLASFPGHSPFFNVAYVEKDWGAWGRG